MKGVCLPTGTQTLYHSLLTQASYCSGRRCCSGVTGWGGRGGGPGSGVGWRAGCDPGSDHRGGAWAQVYQVVLCGLIQHLEWEKRGGEEWLSVVMNEYKYGELLSFQLANRD